MNEYDFSKFMILSVLGVLELLWLQVSFLLVDMMVHSFSSGELLSVALRSWIFRPLSSDRTFPIARVWEKGQSKPDPVVSFCGFWWRHVLPSVPQAENMSEVPYVMRLVGAAVQRSSSVGLIGQVLIYPVACQFADPLVGADYFRAQALPVSPGCRYVLKSGELRESMAAPPSTGIR